MTAKKNHPTAGHAKRVDLAGHQAEEDSKRSLRNLNAEACSLITEEILPRHERI